MNRPTSALVGRSMSTRAQKVRAGVEAGTKERHSYKPLRKQFRRDSFNYRQIAREGDVALYEQRWTCCPDPAVCFEVIRVRRREGFHMGARFVAPAEVYPRSEQWGALGWTFCDKDAAFAKLRDVERK